MEVVRLSALRSCRLYPRKYSWHSFLLRGLVNTRVIVRSEGLCQWKIPMTPLEIEPATFRLVAQCLNQLRHQQRAATAYSKYKKYKYFTCHSGPTRKHNGSCELYSLIFWVNNCCIDCGCCSVLCVWGESAFMFCHVKLCYVMLRSWRKETAGAAVRDAVYWLQQGVLYLQNVPQF